MASNTRLVPLGSKGFALIDAEDWPTVSQFSWHLSNKGYARREWRDKKKRRVQLLHNLIMGVKGVDHINRNKLDCRRCNLRMCNQSQNAANTKLSIKNKSGFKGVSWAKDRGKWVAQIFKGRAIRLGAFDTPEAAARAYAQKAKELFGEFA